MAINQLGDLVSFQISGVTHYGVVIGLPDTTHNVVAYGFDVPHVDRMTWVHEYNTTSTTQLEDRG